MKPIHIIGLLFSHGAIFGVGFALGIYLLPILIAPDSPSSVDIQAEASQHEFHGEFVRDLEDSDSLHWGEGAVTIGARSISFSGKLAPGPDYQLYLSPKFIETEKGFAQFKSQMVKVGPVKTFDRFLLDIPTHINPEDYQTVIIWCETFGEFITATTYSRR